MTAPNNPSMTYTEAELQTAIQALIDTKTEADIMQLLIDYPFLRNKKVVEQIQISFVTLAITEHWSQHAKDAMYQRANSLAGMVDSFGDQIGILDGMSTSKTAPASRAAAPTVSADVRQAPTTSRRSLALIIAAVLIGVVLLSALITLLGSGGSDETPQAAAPTPTLISTTLTIGGDCTLADAILAANTGAASGGCPAGSAATLIVLTEDMMILAESPDAETPQGLPPIARWVTIDGSAVRWSEDTPQLAGFVVEPSGSLTLRHVTVSGGGIGVYNRGTLNVFDSTFSNNQGGAIYNTGMLTVANSTFDHNSAAQHGGAIYNTLGGATITNSTFSANVAGGTGGAIYSFPDSRPDLPFTVTNCTFTANYAPGGFGAIALNAFHGGDIVLRNSVLVGNVDNTHETNCDLHTGSGNIDGDGSCPNSERMGLEGLDTALADNGGPTLTHALLAGSAAIDAGDPQYCPPNDQRGASRAGRCDAGAFEFDGVVLGE